MARRYRTYTMMFKSQVAEEFLTGNWPVRVLAEKYHIDHRLVRIWVEKYRAGEFTGAEAEDAIVADYEDRIAELERKVGQLVMENELLKKRLEIASHHATANSSIVSGPRVYPSPEDVA